MPSERWMAATGAAVVAVSLLGMFHLTGGGSAARRSRRGRRRHRLRRVSWLLSRRDRAVGAWIVLGLLFVVGMLLYFNMTVGDLLAAWLQRRDDRAELAASRRARRRGPARAQSRSRSRRSRRASRHPGPDAQRARRGSRRRRAAADRATRSPSRPSARRRTRPPSGTCPFPVGSAEPGQPVAAVSVEVLKSEEEQHLAEVGESDALDAALESVDRVWELPELAAPGRRAGQQRRAARPDKQGASASRRRWPISASA